MFVQPWDAPLPISVRWKRPRVRKILFAVSEDKKCQSVTIQDPDRLLSITRLRPREQIALFRKARPLIALIKRTPCENVKMGRNCPSSTYYFSIHLSRYGLQSSTMKQTPHEAKQRRIHRFIDELFSSRRNLAKMMKILRIRK